ncbi:MAG: sulfatase-like hydrolase/transferase [Tahibacter sp.]
MSGSTKRRSRALLLVAIILVVSAVAVVASRRSLRSPPNVLLITLDTVRADHLGCYGAGEADTPTLDRLAHGGVRFDRAYSSAPLTLPAHASLMTGLQPLTHGLTDNGMRASRFPVDTLAERVREAGYDTAAFVAAFVLHSTHGLDRGFNHYDDGPDEAGGVFRMFRGTAPASERVDRLLEWLRLPRKAPFFAWLHLYDAHAPYLPPEGFAKRFASHPYDGEIAYVDSQLARIVAYLERGNLLDNTLIVVTADHGEGLGEHGEVTHGVFLYDATLRVPLIMSWPGRLASRVETEPAALVDVMPTLLGLLDLAPQPLTHGADLFAPAAKSPPWRFFSYSNYPHRQYGWAVLAALRRGGLKYIDAPHPELYDTGKDPAELTNLLDRGSRIDSGAQLGDAVSIAVSELSAQAIPAQVDAKMDPQQRQRLQSLGYLAGHDVELSGDETPIDPKDGLRTLGPIDTAFEALANGRLAQAESLFHESLLAAPHSLTAQDGMARTLELLGREAEAEQLHEHILSVDPDAVLSLARLVEMRTRRGDCASAAPPADRLKLLLHDTKDVDLRLSRCRPPPAAIDPPSR